MLYVCGMSTDNKTTITVESTIAAPAAKVWEYWTAPEHITQWCQASDDWHAPAAEQDLRAGGAFKTVMAAKDGSAAFDFTGVYTSVEAPRHIAYTIADGRQVSVTFTEQGATTRVTETFEPESINPPEMQQAGWQAILDNFRKYTESH